MNAARPEHVARLVRIFKLLIVAATLGQLACASGQYAPEPIDTIGFLARTQTQSEAGVRVRVAVPTAGEAERAFGLPLARRGIQPIWLEITNQRETRIRYAPVGTDRVYFAPIEVAYMHKRAYKGDAYRAMETALYDSAMSRWIWPGETRSGFVFTHHDPGTKAFNVDLFTGGNDDPSFTFFVQVPDQLPDHSDVGIATLYSEDAIRQLDLKALRTKLDELDCCTKDQTGTRDGLPINLILVGTGQKVLRALLRAGWYERSRVQRSEELALEQHWDGRGPDAVFRTRRAGKADRNELRVWKAPAAVDGEQLWVGQITHYIGRSTQLGRALFDPRLDPDVDEARDYMLQLMWYSQALEGFAWKRTDHAVPSTELRADFQGVQYFTDGGRVVLWLSARPISQIKVTDVGWDGYPKGAAR
jgi:hypothetical protein